jgi:HAE1 family hydrophobic/amphiphilic exporter-1
VNNAIVLVDYTNKLRKNGMELQEAVITAGRTRVRPILMTALTTILAMIPMTLGLGSGSEMWAPLAKAVVGGLTISTLLTLLVVPVIYTIFENISARWKERRELRKKERAAVIAAEQGAE